MLIKMLRVQKNMSIGYQRFKKVYLTRHFWANRGKKMGIWMFLFDHKQFHELYEKNCSLKTNKEWYEFGHSNVPLGLTYSIFGLICEVGIGFFGWKIPIFIASIHSFSRSYVEKRIHSILLLQVHVSHRSHRLDGLTMQRDYYRNSVYKRATLLHSSMVLFPCWSYSHM